MVSGPSGWRGPAVTKLCWWTRSVDVCLWVPRTTWPPSAWTTSASGLRRCQRPPVTVIPKEGALGAHCRLSENTQGDGFPGWTLQHREHPKSLTCVSPRPLTSIAGLAGPCGMARGVQLGREGHWGECWLPGVGAGRVSPSLYRQGSAETEACLF